MAATKVEEVKWGVGEENPPDSVASMAATSG